MKSENHECRVCGKSYTFKRSLARHLKYECGVEPQFHCQHCAYKAKHKNSLVKHVAIRHHKSLDL